MGLLCGRAGRLHTKNAGCQPGQARRRSPRRSSGPSPAPGSTAPRCHHPLWTTPGHACGATTSPEGPSLWRGAGWLPYTISIQGVLPFRVIIAVGHSRKSRRSFMDEQQSAVRGMPVRPGERPARSCAPLPRTAVRVPEPNCRRGPSGAAAASRGA
jgi:hypothetical protein